MALNRPSSACRPRRSTLVLSSLIAAISSATCVRADKPPPPAATREGRWRQDLHYLADNLPRLHISAFHTLTREQFNNAVDAIDKDIDRLSDAQITIRMMQLVGSIGDGHTKLWGEASLKTLPIRIRWFSDGLFIAVAPAEYAEAVGAKLLRIESVDTAAALKAVTTLIPRDNEQQLRYAAPDLLAKPELLNALGLTSSPNSASLTFRTPKGDETTVLLQSLAPGTKVRWAKPFDSSRVRAPLCFQQTQKPYWFTHIAEKSLLYVAYNSCVDWKEKPFKDFTREVFQSYDANQPHCLVIDLRNNQGGDSSVFDPFLHRLTRLHLDKQHHLFACIGPGTYSSGVMNAIDLQKKAHALLIGEPTGGKPNCYGEVRDFRLPNCGLQVNYPTRYVRSLWFADPQFLAPDVLVETSSSDYFAGRDPVVEEAIKRSSVSDRPNIDP